MWRLGSVVMEGKLGYLAGNAWLATSNKQANQAAPLKGETREHIQDGMHSGGNDVAGVRVDHQQFPQLLLSGTQCWHACGH